jgi:CRP-like cAMP-binding protein
MYRTVLVPLDGSPFAEQALPLAVALTMAASSVPVGLIQSGECLGEMSLLTGAVHSATATAQTPVKTAVLGHEDLTELIRLRPDIGLLIYRNLAVGTGEKLKRLDVTLTGRP